MTRSGPPKAATLHDVAREAGVSLITASRALSNPGMVSEKTIEIVKGAARRTGYIPNLLAGSLKSSRSMTVAGLVPIISVPQFLPTVRVLTEVLDEHGYQLILGQSGYDNAREEKLIATMIGRRPDGLVVTGLVQSERARQQLRSLGIPVVEVWDLCDDPVDMVVGFSHTEVGSTVAGYFVSQGRRRLAVATGGDHRAQLRRKGFVAAVGHDVPTATGPSPSSLERGRKALIELIHEAPKTEAIFCSSDALAQGVMVEALARGIRIPDDLAVCGFGDAEFAAHLVPSLSTVHVDGAQIGRVAAQLILDRCNDKDIASRIIDLGFRMVERETTATGAGHRPHPDSEPGS